MKARRWSSGGTLTSFYLRDLCLQADSIRKTGPVVAAGEFVVISSSVYLGIPSIPLSFSLKERGAPGGPHLGSGRWIFVSVGVFYGCHPGARTGRRPSISVRFWFYLICHMNHSNYLSHTVIEVFG